MVSHHFLESLPAYAAGALAGSQKDELEKHLKEGCDLCTPELFLLSEASGRLPHALPAVPLPSGLRNRLRSRIESEFPAKTEQKPRAASSGILWRAAAVLAIAIAGWLFWQWQATTRSFTATVAGQEEEIGRLK